MGTITTGKGQLADSLDSLRDNDDDSVSLEIRDLYGNV